MRFDKIAFVISLALLAIAVATANTEANDDSGASARQKFQLPKLFDFERFKSVFKKGYKSIAEELVRQKLFLARGFRAFVSAIKYKHNLSPYYLRVNNLSDRTDDELNLRLLRRSDQVANDIKSIPNVPLVDKEEIERELEKVQERANEAGFSEIAKELNGRQKRDVESKREQLSLDDLAAQLSDKSESPEVKAKLRYIVPSDNPNYQAPELMSFGAESPNEEETNEMDPGTLKSILEADELRKKDSQGKDSSYLGDLVSQLASTVKAGYTSIVDNVIPSAPPLPDQVYLDHRESGCFMKPRNQGPCSSCAIFSFASLLEFLLCKATGKLTQISEQYMVDCGDREHPTNTGCSSGNYPYFMGKFIENHGLELGARYPYIYRKEICPYSRNTPPKNMGYLRPNVYVKYWPVEELKKVLTLTPVLLQIAIKGSSIAEYGGGVYDLHDSIGCKTRTLDHAVLAVGHGREDGRDYWLIRNSWGPDWGESGYFKLEKSADCIFDDIYAFIHAKTGSVGFEVSLNGAYDPTTIQNYQKNYVLPKERQLWEAYHRVHGQQMVHSPFPQ